MVALAVLGGSPCASPSYLFRSASHRTTSLSYTPSHLNLHRSHHNLAPFQPQSNLLSYYPSRPLAPKKNRKKPHIFLPHLVASLEKVDKSYIMVKPDGVQRGLEQYKDLKSKPFFPKLIDYITSGPVVCMAWEGVGVVASARKLIGVTNPLQAEPVTIRGDLAVQTGRNVVHGSDSPENGEREIALWFKEGEICEWSPAQAPWLME
ncbi:nucleoside diphosphate kinase 2, chloroplastic-like isoform X1 [Actinidia eriantha]|uniref:nucleoside diphosphate kinase 2, chloroplastic-like isoform X1 n=1 Tax=Actinidia eriantha TaxID=165200 RepID=UPI002583AF02|nr:nucleoside diphosphate kinase 2, chloroplastic-like isoform X1 [Actinidia eriantha]